MGTPGDLYPVDAIAPGARYRLRYHGGSYGSGRRSDGPRCAYLDLCAGDGHRQSGCRFVAESMGWMRVPILMAVLCGLALALGLRGRRIRDQYLAEVAGEKEAEAANRALGSC